MAAGTYFFKLSMNKLLNSSFKLLIAQASSNLNESKADQNGLGQTYIQSLKVGVGSLSLLIGWAIRMGPATLLSQVPAWEAMVPQVFAGTWLVGSDKPLTTVKTEVNMEEADYYLKQNNFTLILFNNLKLKESPNKFV